MDEEADSVSEPEIMEETRRTKPPKSTEQSSSELPETEAAITMSTQVYTRTFVYDFLFSVLMGFMTL